MLEVLDCFFFSHFHPEGAMSVVYLENEEQQRKESSPISKV